jgi:hypothetical protein
MVFSLYRIPSKGEQYAPINRHRTFHLPRLAGTRGPRKTVSLTSASVAPRSRQRTQACSDSRIGFMDISMPGIWYGHGFLP